MPQTPYRKRRNPRRPQTMIPDYGLPPVPPTPAVVHITNLQRTSETVLRFTFDVVILDPGGCGDLRVAGQNPAGSVQIDDYTLDATYPAMANGNPWTAHVIDGEPIFADGAVLADDGGTVPTWA